jgi:hypothetical protein
MSARRQRIGRILTGSAAAVLVVAGLWFVLFSPLPSGVASAKPSIKGVVDSRLEAISVKEPAAIPAMVAEFGPSRLGARWTRIVVHWPALEPTAPAADGTATWNAAYVQQLHDIARQLHEDAGVNIVFTLTESPKWASDSALWSTPPGGYARGYQSFDAPKIDDPAVASAFTGAAAYLASEFHSDVGYFECWNEPNLFTNLYPQNKPYGVRAYLKMLKAFHKGIKQGNPSAWVIAGATAPRGNNSKAATAPQTFAAYLRDHGASAYFDAYSHHPYTPGGSIHRGPTQPPDDPTHSVLLSNLPQLLKLFPHKPFLLTEYGYSTTSSRIFGLTVSLADQARYLQQAYAMMAKYPQVKALMWYLVNDWGDPKTGVGAFTGLCKVDGTRKPSWYVFAGGTSLSVYAPIHSGVSARFGVTGKLVNSKTGPLPGVKLQLQTKSATGWKTKASALTGADGTYNFGVSQKKTKTYRVVWDGVTQSVKRTIYTP